MKAQKQNNANTSLNDAFDKINSAVGEELNEIVSVIEDHGRKQKLKSIQSSNVIQKVKKKAKQLLSFAK